MNLHINPKDGKPIYRQIMDQIKYLIASGRLQPGQELPTVRGLAQELIINPNTVARAYRELEQVGVLATRQGSGTFVSTRGTPLSREYCERLIGDRVVALVAEARQLDFELNEVFALVREEYNKLLKEKKESAHDGSENEQHGG
ncbi:MAG TPA: GntR family transcriptional regulator [Candidatus Hydrogenedentes bacterium]|nr:GntR family transcriptional regulator [Candidatus Hydrogenedentota bacterium]